MCGKDINGGDYENDCSEDQSHHIPITGRIYRQLQPRQFDTEEKEVWLRNFQHPGDRY